MISLLPRSSACARCLLSSLLLLALVQAPAVAQTPAETLRRHLEAGEARQAVTLLEPLAVGEPQARMALGFAQTIQSVERLMQGMHRYGFNTPGNPFVPVLRLPVPVNPSPEPVDYDKVRALYATFLKDIATARTTLLAVPATDAKLVLDLHTIRLKSAGPGDPGISLQDLMATLGGQRGGTLPPWEVAFDRSDCLWLAGYTHMLSATFEFIMAHDWRATFEATAPAFFPKASNTNSILPATPDPAVLPSMGAQLGGVADQIAFLHLIHWPAGDKTRMRAALGHLKAMSALSRETWKSILAETDDDREWLPAPRQQSRAVPGMPITDETVAGWHAVLDDLDALLDGRKLLGHWRTAKGIDVRMIFEDPKPFDLVLWLTGHGVQPFLKEGVILDGTALQNWNRVFRNNFLGYAFFIN